MSLWLMLLLLVIMLVMFWNIGRVMTWIIWIVVYLAIVLIGCYALGTCCAILLCIIVCLIIEVVDWESAIYVISNAVIALVAWFINRVIIVFVNLCEAFISINS